MPKNLFYKSLFIIEYILKSKITAIILVNTYTDSYDFIDKEYIEKICRVFKNKLQYLIKLK